MKYRFLIKIGGLAFQKPAGLRDLGIFMKTNPHAEFIILHGGGTEISKALEAAGRPSCFVDGIRFSHEKDIKIVEEVLSQKVNQRIVDVLEASDVNCKGMSGKTNQLLSPNH